MGFAGTLLAPLLSHVVHEHVGVQGWNQGGWQSVEESHATSAVARVRVQLSNTIPSLNKRGIHPRKSQSESSATVIFERVSRRAAGGPTCDFMARKVGQRQQEAREEEGESGQ